MLGGIESARLMPLFLQSVCLSNQRKHGLNVILRGHRCTKVACTPVTYVAHILADAGVISDGTVNEDIQLAA